MRLIKLILAIFLLLLLTSAGIIFSKFKGPVKDSPQERFVVKPSDTEEAVINRLIESGFLRNREIFEISLFIRCWKQKGCPVVGQRINPGGYLISKSDDAYQIAKALLQEPYQKWVTIPPGKRKEQTALILGRALGWDEKEIFSFIDSAKEGYLFPDTYLIDSEAIPYQVTQRLEANFNNKFDDQVYQQLLAANVRNDTAVKIASLIERESGGDYDKPIIAGIILNRLEKGMRLEIDATVQYAVASRDCQFSEADPKGKIPITECHFWPAVTGNQLRTTPSSYNTYLNQGLPTGPICSPSLASIEAVANPADTEALFYLHSADKKIHIAKTYQEHQENIEKFLR